MRAAALVLCASVALAAAGQAPGPAPASATPAQSPPAANGNTQQRPASQKDLANAVIRGRVVRADTGEPIEGATVATTVSSQSIGFPSMAVSDARGRFELKNLPAGNYQLMALAGGFAQTPAGSRRPGDDGRTISLTAGQVVQNVNFALPRAAVISGVVLDERGDPLPNAVVAVLRPFFSGGQRRLQPINRGAPSYDQVLDVSDDLGQFRVWGVTPGTYYLAAAQPSTERFGYASRSFGNSASVTLFPGNDAAPQPLEVGAGQEISGISLTAKQVRTAAIRGTVSGRDGSTSAEIRLVREGDVPWVHQFQATGGTFTTQVPPGHYTVFARKDDQIAAAPVVVDEADVMVPLILGNGTTVRGRVVTDSGDLPEGLRPSDVSLEARSTIEPTMWIGGNSGADGSFQLTGIPTAFRLTVFSRNAQWAIESVRISGTEVWGTVLGTTRGDIENVEVVLTQQRTTITGLVRDAGKPSGDATVIVFPEDEDRRWPGGPYVRVLRPEADGRFSVRGLPPARYLAVAVDYLEFWRAGDPEIFEPLSRAATRFTLGQGASQVLNLRVTKGP